MAVCSGKAQDGKAEEVRTGGHQRCGQPRSGVAAAVSLLKCEGQNGDPPDGEVPERLGQDGGVPGIPGAMGMLLPFGIL